MPPRIAACISTLPSKINDIFADKKSKAWAEGKSEALGRVIAGEKPYRVAQDTGVPYSWLHNNAFGVKDKAGVEEAAKAASVMAAAQKTAVEIKGQLV